MARSLEDILAEFGPSDQVIFEPVKPEVHKDAETRLPPTFLPSSHPFDYFTLFLFNTITTNTNQYAATQRLHITEDRARKWDTVIVDELYVLIGAVIYMGMHDEPNPAMYWTTDKTKGPLHTLSHHISLRRYEQIKRYCHISWSESDQRTGYDLPTNKRWWYKLEPLASSIQASSQQYYNPSSKVSIDEIMVRCSGR
jgi:hypothetical protein